MFLRKKEISPWQTFARVLSLSSNCRQRIQNPLSLTARRRDYISNRTVDNLKRYRNYAITAIFINSPLLFPYNKVAC